MFQLSHRHTSLIPQVEWFSFPERCKLWRGSSSPTHDHLKNGGVSSYAAGAATSARGPSLDGESLTPASVRQRRSRGLCYRRTRMITDRNWSRLMAPWFGFTFQPPKGSIRRRMTLRRPWAPIVPEGGLVAACRRGEAR